MVFQFVDIQVLGLKLEYCNLSLLIIVDLAGVPRDFFPSTLEGFFHVKLVLCSLVFISSL